MAPQRQLAAPAYLLAFCLCFTPLYDMVLSLIPFKIHDPHWRYGEIGIFCNVLLLPLVGFLIAFVTSGTFDHRRFQRVLGVIAFIAALGLVGLVGIFSLDALQTRHDVRANAVLAFKVAGLTAIGKYGIAILTLGLFGYAAFRGPKAVRGRSGQATPLIVGKSE